MWGWNGKFQFFVIHVGFVSQDDMFDDVCFPRERSSTEVATEFQSRSPQFLCGQKR